MKRKHFIRMTAVCMAALMVFGASEAWAKEGEDEETALKSGPSVRRKLLYRSTRFELTPAIGVTSGDSYIRNAVVGLNASYYLTNSIGIGLSGGYSPLHTETSLAQNVKKSIDEDGTQEELDDLTFSYLQWFGAFEIKYVPIFGKFSLMNETSLSYDIHIIGGAALIGQEACNASELDTSCAFNDEAPADEDLVGLRPAGTIGAGFRIFVGDAYALNLQVRDHLYRRAQTSTGDAEANFSSNVYLSLGFSLFFPQTVKISR